VRQEGKLIGIAPFLDDVAGQLGCPRSLVFPVNPHAVRNDIICSVDLEAVLDAILTHLRQKRPHLRLQPLQVKGTSPLLPALNQLAEKHGLKLLLREGSTSPFIKISSDWPGYLQSRPSAMRRELRRKQRNLAKVHEVKWTVTSDLESWQRVLPDLMHIERNCWKEKAGSSFTADRNVGQFYATLAEAWARQGLLRLYLLYLDQRPVAHFFGVVFNKTYFALKTSFDEAYRAHSPGTVLFTFALEDTFNQGLSFFDLLGEKSRWKCDFATDVAQTVSICAYSSGLLRCHLCTLYQQIFVSKLKPLIKEKMPRLLRAKRYLWSLNPWRPPPPGAPQREE
jgi:hypothetical protein